MKERESYIWELIILIILIAFLLFCSHAWAEVPPSINLEKIMLIESSGNPLAYNKEDDSIGLYQITPICLKEYNNFHPKNNIHRGDLWNPKINRGIANWYLNDRIPQMLRHFKKPVTTENIIISYNAGISYVVNNKPLPKITKQYIRKYRGR